MIGKMDHFELFLNNLCIQAEVPIDGSLYNVLQVFIELNTFYNCVHIHVSCVCTIVSEYARSMKQLVKVLAVFCVAISRSLSLYLIAIWCSCSASDLSCIRALGILLTF